MGIIPLPVLKLNLAVDGEPGHMCCSLCSRNNSPQGVTDVIQILDFQHFKVSASGSLNNWRLRPSKRNVSVEEKVSLPRIYQSRFQKCGWGCIPATQASNIDSFIFAIFYSLTYTILTSSSTTSIWTSFERNCFQNQSFLTNVEALDMDCSQWGEKQTQTLRNQTRRRSNTDK